MKLDPLSNLAEFSPVTVDSLKSLTQILIGVAVPAGQASNSVLTSSKRSSVVMKHFSQISAENIMKMDALQPSQGTFNFTEADALVNYANNNGLTLHGHVLVWHSQIPTWIQIFPVISQLGLILWRIMYFKVPATLPEK
ncbi:endo-1,4-beta-xylanase [Catenovulum adriaticum]|uniref:endo-1,4-beta-xylanase n=1 Tax=Catenovulum adriaticum TaxID=2984846 RepID=UPI002DD65768|nr:endo-1,4-beta-xylanase [Catenovulum sp. TS8]